MGQEEGKNGLQTARGWEKDCKWDEMSCKASEKNSIDISSIVLSTMNPVCPAFVTYMCVLLTAASIAATQARATEIQVITTDTPRRRASVITTNCSLIAAIPVATCFPIIATILTIGTSSIPCRTAEIPTTYVVGWTTFSIVAAYSSALKLITAPSWATNVAGRAAGIQATNRRFIAAEQKSVRIATGFFKAAVKPCKYISGDVIIMDQVPWQQLSRSRSDLFSMVILAEDSLCGLLALIGRYGRSALTGSSISDAIVSRLARRKAKNRVNGSILILY